MSSTVSPLLHIKPYNPYQSSMYIVDNVFMLGDPVVVGDPPGGRFFSIFVEKKLKVIRIA